MKNKLDVQIKELFGENNEYLTCPTCKRGRAMGDSNGRWRCVWTDCSESFSYSELMSWGTAQRLKLLKTDLETLKRLGLWT